MSRYEPVESPDETTIFPYHSLTPPTTDEIYRARQIVRQHLPRTPLVRSDALSARYDAEVYLKREETLPTGAFKVRGGVTLAASLDDEFQNQGLIAASTGNHGQSVAYAGREVGIPVTIAVPEDANPSKIVAMERLGATVEQRGADFDAAREWAEEQAIETGARYVHSANEPKLVAGVATAGLEVVEDLPEVDLLATPVGGGSSASGYCLTVGELGGAEVIGVQTEAAPAVYEAWQNDHLDSHERMETFAEGMATRVPFALTTRILRDRLDDFLLVSDDDLRDAAGRLLDEERIVAEGAAVAGLAGLEAMKDELAGKTVVAPLTGRNVSDDTLASFLE